MNFSVQSRVMNSGAYYSSRMPKVNFRGNSVASIAVEQEKETIDVRKYKEAIERANVSYGKLLDLYSSIVDQGKKLYPDEIADIERVVNTKYFSTELRQKAELLLKRARR